MSTQTLDSVNTGSAVTAESLMEDLRLVVADAGDSAVSSEQAAKVAGQYVHDNHWNWH